MYAHNDTTLRNVHFVYIRNWYTLIWSYQKQTFKVNMEF
jgi:hypothetical protein